MTTAELHKDPVVAEEMAADAVVQYLHEANVEGEQDKKQWIQRVFEY
jgi:hypothetical protein